ncbi:MAG: class I SAM-dependent methyltransferase [Candidatus Neomarinimicrobiota bacterium]|jgi:ubiquinone/menaquinone biosynthesis C-methylase UbiE|nr:class I SAM-dependent methyltransferase [Candidatus Neomarinimicrobiota bacterium]|tara:strand:+ start:113 stop:808 length:696 start_codon:yes stop_codon:yes gene_type:complete
MTKSLKTAVLLFSVMIHASLGLAQSYTYKSPSRDGIGKIYQGREISKVMGHLGASWLERSSRANEESPNLAVDLLDLKKDMIIADFGAGTGYFTSKLARKCSIVYAVDIQQEMLDLNAKQMRNKNINNVKFILGFTDRTGLPKNSLDLVILVDVYHELENPLEIMNDIKSSLNQTGKVALIEYRKEDPTVPIKPLHKMSVEQVVKEMRQVNLKLHSNIQELPRQHMLIFSK